MSSFGGKDRDERYQDYLEDGSMFGKMDFEEWSRREDRAQEIADGTISGIFERDEDIWKRVKRIQEEK